MPALGNPQDLNRYSYVRNNPLGYSDPSGHFVHIAIGAVIGAVVGAVVAVAPKVIRNIRDGQPLTANIDPKEGNGLNWAVGVADLCG